MQNLIEVLERAKKGTGPEYFKELSDSLNRCGYLSGYSPDLVKLKDVLKSLPSNCRPDLDDVVIFVISHTNRCGRLLMYEVFVDCKVRRLTRKMIEMLDDTCFRSSDRFPFSSGVGFYVLHHLVTTKKFCLAKKVLNRGLDFICGYVQHIITDCNSTVEDLEFVVTFARVRGIKLDLDFNYFRLAATYSSADIVAYLFTSGLFGSVPFSELSTYEEWMIHGHDTDDRTAKTHIFLLNIGVFSPDVAFDSTRSVNVKFHILENMLVNDVDFSGISYDFSDSQFTLATNLVLDRCLSNQKSPILDIMITSTGFLKRLRNLASFRVMSTIVNKGPFHVTGHGMHVFTEADRLETLKRVFKAGEYGPKDPGFLLMFWAMTRRGGRRRLPREITRLVFEAAYMQ